MPRAGYCSECNGYVWLGADGRCPARHDPGHLRDVHVTEALPSPVGTPPQVAAEEPRAVPDGFSWGAFLIPVFWCLAYGVPEYAAVAFASALLAGLVIPEAAPSLGLVASLTQLGVYVWIGFAAPKAFWRKHANKMSPAAYRAKQTKWIVIGIAGPLMLIGLAIFATAG